MAFRDKTLREALNTDIRELFGPKKGQAPAIIPSAFSHEANLEVRPTADKLEFICTTNQRTFFRVRGRMTGSLSVMLAQPDGRTPAVNVTVPVDMGARSFTVSLSYRGERLDAEWGLQQSSTAVFPDKTRLIEFIFGEDREQAVYSFTLPDSIEVLDFERMERVEPESKGAPPVGQMAALFRAALKHRYDTLSFLYDLSPAMSIATLKLVNLLKEKAGTRSLPSSQPVLWLDEILAAKKKRFNPEAMMAWGILLDMEMGTLLRSDIENMSAEQPVLTSWTAIYHIALFFGEELNEAEWTVKCDAAGLPSPDSILPDEGEIARRTLTRMQERMDARDILGVLSAICKEMPSRIVDDAVQLWRETKAKPTADPFRGCNALFSFLKAQDVWTMHNTVVALCLYTELELGRMTLDMFSDWLENSRSFSLTPYTLEAVSEAFEVDVHIFMLASAERSLSYVLTHLLPLSRAGLMLEVEDKGSHARAYHFVDRQCKFTEELPDPAHLTGIVLFKPGVLGRLTERELDIFLSLGHPLYASFLADVDRRRAWKRIPAEHVNDPDRYNFLHGFRTFSIHNCILAEVIPRNDTTDPMTTPLIFRDERGNIHYYHPSNPPTASRGMHPQDLEIHFPEIESMPDFLIEAGQGTVLGMGDRSAGKVATLDLLAAGLPQFLTRKHSYKLLTSYSSAYKALRQHIGTKMRVLLEPLIGASTVDALTKVLDTDPPVVDLRLHDAAFPWLSVSETLDVISFSLVLELCSSPIGENEVAFKVINKNRLRANVINQLVQVMESKQPESRVGAMVLAGTSTFVRNKEERLVLEYELNRAIEDPEHRVAMAACESLTRIVMEDVMPLPVLWQIKVVQGGPATSPVQKQAMSIMNTGQELRTWGLRVNETLFGAPEKKESEKGPAISNQVKGLALLLAGARQSVRKDEQDGVESRRFSYLLVTRAILRELYENTLGSWHAMAASLRRSLDDFLNEGNGPKTRLDYRNFVTHNETYKILWKPLVESWPERITRWSFEEVDGSPPFWVFRNTTTGIETSPFFFTLMQRGLQEGVDTLQLCRVPHGAFDKGEPMILSLEVLQTRQGEFQPFFEYMQALGAGKLTAAEQDFATLLASLAGTGDGEGQSESGAIEEQEDVSPLAGTDRPLIIDEVPGPWIERANQIIQVFQLPESYLHQVLYIIRGTGPVLTNLLEPPKAAKTP